MSNQFQKWSNQTHNKGNNTVSLGKFTEEKIVKLSTDDIDLNYNLLTLNELKNTIATAWKPEFDSVAPLSIYYASIMVSSMIQIEDIENDFNNWDLKDKKCLKRAITLLAKFFIDRGPGFDYNSISVSQYNNSVAFSSTDEEFNKVIRTIESLLTELPNKYFMRFKGIENPQETRLQRELHGNRTRFMQEHDDDILCDLERTDLTNLWDCYYMRMDKVIAHAPLIYTHPVGYKTGPRMQQKNEFFLKLSEDPGNLATLGTDGGLLVKITELLNKIKKLEKEIETLKTQFTKL